MRKLENLLKQLAPGADESRILWATDFASRWILQYREKLSGSDLRVAAFWEEIDQGRREMQALARTIHKLRAQINTLSPIAKKELRGHWTSVIRKHLDMEKREFVTDVRFITIFTELSDLPEILKGAEFRIASKARSFHKPRPSKLWNPEAFLASGMCQTLGTCLGVKVVMTHDEQRAGRRPTSANYSHLLRLALEIAGTQPPENLLPAMKAGFKLAYPFEPPISGK